jgi:protein-disulfide isomerase
MKHRNRQGTYGMVAIASAALMLSACGGENARAETHGEPAALRPSAVGGAPAAAPLQAAPTDTIDVRRIGYAEGPEEAPVTVIEFSDFGCPFCAMFAQGTYPELRREFIDTGRVRWVFVPFVMGSFPNGAEAARTGECAAEQGRFPEMKMRIYAGQREWRSTRNAASVFTGYAKELGLDAARFASCYREDRLGERTRTNNRAANAVGIRATPSFLINGRLVEGALPPEQFRMILTRLSEESR